MVFLIFIQVLIEIMQANSGYPDQTPHSLASDLGLHYFPMSHKKDARQIWVKKCNNFAYLIRNLGNIFLK